MRLIRRARGAVQANKAAIERALVQPFFRRWIAEAPPQLQAVDAQQGLHRKRWVSTLRLTGVTGVWLDGCDQGLPRNNLGRLLKKILVRLPLQRAQSQRDWVLSPVFASLHVTRRFNGWGFADIPWSTLTPP